jgi:hypothetical protein
VGHSTEQRSTHPLCNAKKRDGSRCRAFAGQGTDHPGVGSCKFHSGSTPNGKKSALALQAKHRMVAMSVPVEDAQPHAILLQELTVSAGHVGWLREEIASLPPEEIGDERSRVLLTRYDDERERLTRIAKACSDAGVDEATIRVEQVKLSMVAKAMQGAMRDIGLSPRHVEALGPAFRKQLALMQGDDATADAMDARVAEVRRQIQTADDQRIEKAAQRFSGLTFPPEELVPEPSDAA